MKRVIVMCLAVLAGCATPSRRALEQRRHEREMEDTYRRMIAPMPPKVVLSEAAKARIEKAQELHPFIPRTTFTFHVEDCAPQPEGVSYRVNESADMVTWTLCDSATVKHDGTNHAVTVLCDKPMRFYTVTVFRESDGVEKKAMKECK